MPPMFPLLSSVTLLASFIARVHAQGTNATCLPGYEWMFNSRGQSPCLITAYLNTPCLSNPADAFVFSLPDGFHYRPPIPETATACQCSTIFYSTIQACAICQNETIVPWSTWNSNCTTAVYESVYSLPIPSGTAIPGWAYLDVTFSDNFNATAAKAFAATNPQESLASNQPPTTVNNAPSSTSDAAPSGTGTPPPVSKKSNTGPIVGGVVGGIGGIAIIAGLAFFLWRYLQNNKTPKQDPYMNPNVLAPGVPFGEKPYDDGSTVASPTVAYSNLTHTPPPPGHGNGAGYSPMSLAPAGKLYDPNDPSTFPNPHPHTSMVFNTPTPPPNPGSGTSYPSTPSHHPSSNMHGGHYHGTPEV